MASRRLVIKCRCTYVVWHYWDPVIVQRRCWRIRRANAADDQRCQQASLWHPAHCRHQRRTIHITSNVPPSPCTTYDAADNNSNSMHCHQRSDMPAHNLTASAATVLTAMQWTARLAHIRYSSSRQPVRAMQMTRTRVGGRAGNIHADVVCITGSAAPTARRSCCSTALESVSMMIQK